MTGDPISVRFYVHAETPVPERRRRVTRRLTRLATRGTIEAFQVELWPKVVSLEALGEASNDVLETYEAIQAWADRAGATVTPPFAIVADRWEATGETDTRLHTPNMCLLVERDGELVGVFPHQRDEGVWTLQDGLDALETESEVVISVDPGADGIENRASGDDLAPAGREPAQETDPGNTLDPIER